jgi:hypothetical protein
LPANWPALQVFLAAGSQWRLGPAGGFIGLDYQGVEVAIQRLGLEATPEAWRGMQVIEATVVEEMIAARQRPGA